MKKHIFLKLTSQLLNIVQYGLAAFIGLMLFVLLVLLFGGQTIQNSLETTLPSFYLGTVFFILIISILLLLCFLFITKQLKALINNMIENPSFPNKI